MNDLSISALSMFAFIIFSCPTRRSSALAPAVPALSSSSSSSAVDALALPERPQNLYVHSQQQSEQAHSRTCSVRRPAAKVNDSSSGYFGYYCTFYPDNRAPKQRTLLNCTQFKDSACCQQKELGKTFEAAKPLPGSLLFFAFEDSRFHLFIWSPSFWKF